MVASAMPLVRKAPPGAEVEEDEEERGGEWKEPLCPWTAVLCLVCAGVTFVAEVLVLSLTELGPRWGTPSAEEVWHARTAVLLVLSALITELCFLASTATNANYLGFNLSDSLQRHRAGDSVLTLAEYGAKVLTALYMGFGGGGIVHTDTLAWGGPRPVYLARFMQWSFSVPILVLISNRCFYDRCTLLEMAVRSTPPFVAASFFCSATWVMEVTTNPTARWTLFGLALVGAILVVADQLHLAYIHRREELFSWKATMLAYQILCFIVLTTIFLGGRFNWFSSLTEQMLYAYCDASVKVFQGAFLAMIRNRQDLGIMRSWWVASLAASRDLQSLMQEARVPVLALDLEGRITQWNDNLAKLTGLALAKVKGKRLVEDIASADCRETVAESLAQVLRAQREPSRSQGAFATGNFIELIIPMPLDVRAAGSNPMRQLAMTLVPKSTSEGEFAGVVAIGQDLTDFAQLKIVQERKSALMAMLSHEIRSPLHGILGLSGALLDSESGRSIERQLGMIRGCTSRLLDMVTNVMDLAQNEKRKQNGKPPPRPTLPVNFSAIANEIVTMTDMAVDKMNKPLLRSSVRLVNHLAGVQVPLVPGDPQKCTQLLYNLVTNACKFTDRGTVSINARFEKEKQALEVDVTDTGRGISAEGQKRIFQAFEQESNGDNRSFQGIGLGLSVCTEIMELHAGTLSVSSELGRGSTFTASFPCDSSLGLGEAFEAKAVASPPKRLAEAEPAPAEPEEPPAPREAARSPGRKPLVLSVDDDATNQEVVKAALAGFCEVHCAMGGEQAVGFLEQRKKEGAPLPDAVLLDIQMPGMDGFQVCERIRQGFEADHCKLPVIMVSGRNSTETTAVRRFSAGATGFLQKPFRPEILRQKVQAALRILGDGAGANLIAQEAFARLRDAQERLEGEVDRARAQELRAEAAEGRAMQAEERLALSERRAEKLREAHDEARARAEDLENTCRRLQEQDVAAAAAAKDLGQAALAEERARARSAEVGREEAEAAAREMSDVVRSLTRKLQAREGCEADADQCTDVTHKVGDSEAVVYALASRMEAVNLLARGCFDVLGSCLRKRFSAGPHVEQLDALSTAAEIVAAQLRIMERVSAPAADLMALVAQLDRREGASVFSEAGGSSTPTRLRLDA